MSKSTMNLAFRIIAGVAVVLGVALIGLSIVPSGGHGTIQDAGNAGFEEEDTNGRNGSMIDRIIKTDDEWRNQLTPDQYRITRQKGTEPPFSGEYYNFHGRGTYRCVCCGAELFSSETKFESGSGWPSFYEPATSGSIAEEKDDSHGMRRVEIECARCGAHLGHVFQDGPEPTGLRYCVNSASLKFESDGTSN